MSGRGTLAEKARSLPVLACGIHQASILLFMKTCLLVSRNMAAYNVYAGVVLLCAAARRDAKAAKNV